MCPHLNDLLKYHIRTYLFHAHTETIYNIVLLAFIDVLNIFFFYNKKNFFVKDGIPAQIGMDS